MKMEQTECSETSAYEYQTPGNHPKESIQQVVKTPTIILNNPVLPSNLLAAYNFMFFTPCMF